MTKVTIGPPPAPIEEKVPPEAPVNELMQKVIQHIFCVPSPDSSGYADVIRVDDMLTILCEHFNADPSKTDFSNY